MKAHAANVSQILRLAEPTEDRRGTDPSDSSNRFSGNEGRQARGSDCADGVCEPRTSRMRSISTGLVR